MKADKKLESTGVIQQTTKYNEITITEFHSAKNKNELVYAITCDCVCVG